MLADYYSYWLKTANSRLKKIFIIAYFHKEKYYKCFDGLFAILIQIDTISRIQT